ncbi:group II truncated hemoglobin [Novosphingobium sp.]|uniref:group II truncated hemoglobin n=1 Tax=Novosphingobium sp. TaxID=1874826 RepID=UPI002615A88C|nr:group II truncated hemoglobin [Novosphingobium sp.]
MTPYEAFGGDAFVRSLCARFYALMDVLPEAAACRAVHPPSLVRAEEKLVEYLTGWLGGPPLYTDKYGHPRLRQRHFAAPIGKAEVAGWLLCFHQAWRELAPSSAMADEILSKVDALGWHMANRD